MADAMSSGTLCDNRRANNLLARLVPEPCRRKREPLPDPLPLLLCSDSPLRLQSCQCILRTTVIALEEGVLLVIEQRAHSIEVVVGIYVHGIHGALVGHILLALTQH